MNVEYTDIDVFQVFILCFKFFWNFYGLRFF